MAAFQRFEDIQAWQKSREFTNEIYSLHKNNSFKNDFILHNQLMRAAISISSNIAEGYERGGKNEFIQFLSIAKGSAGEARSQLYIAYDQKYLSAESFQKLFEEITEISRMIDGLITYLKKSDLKGIRYKK
jgi:four helix bundle protein